jgi:glycosyltransferase involved in cell wall biosynthesis
MSHVGIVAMSQPAVGGTFQYTLSMIDALTRIKKNTYTLFTAAGNHSYDSLGLPIIRLPSAAGTVGAVLRKRWLAQDGGLFAEVDKVISPIYSTRLLASRRPFVFTLHDLQEKYYPRNFTMAQLVWRDFVNKSISRRAGAIICESNQVKADICRYLSVDAAKVMVVAAPPVSVFSPEHDEVDACSRALDDMHLPPQFLFYPAQFFPHKNHLRLIHAFSQVLRAFPDCHLLLTGQKKYQYRKVMAQVAELKIQDRVRHLGYLDTDTLAGVYRRAAMVVIPTLFESISIPVYEAFQLGVPVCASRVVALPEQIGDAGVLFDPMSVADMAEKVTALLSDKELQGELIRRGKARVAALTIDRYAVQLESILDGLT